MLGRGGMGIRACLGHRSEVCKGGGMDIKEYHRVEVVRKGGMGIRGYLREDNGGCELHVQGWLGKRLECVKNGWNGYQCGLKQIIDRGMRRW